MAKKSSETAGPKLVTVKLRLASAVVKQLRVEALGRDCSLSDLVAQIWDATPRRFVLSQRQPRDVRADGPQVLAGPKLAEVDAPVAPPALAV